MHKIFLVSALSLFLSSTNSMAAAHRGGAELLNPKAYSINTSAMVFQTAGFYDYEGVEKEIPDSYKYTLTDVDLGVSYGVSRNFEIAASGRFRSVSSTMADITVTKSGLESLGVEGKYAFTPIGLARYALGAHYRQTLYSNPTYNTTNTQIPAEDLILGDAGSEYGVDAYFTYLGGLKWDGKIGYSSPANNLSDEVNYKLEAMYRFSSLGLLAGIEGTYSLKNDEFAETPLQKPIQNTGATALFNSINRERVAPYIGANYAFSKMIIGVKGQTVIRGTSTDKGNSLLVSLGWNSDGVTSESIKINSFKEYQIDGSVLKVSARGNFIRIDQGLSTDVEKGMKFDIYQTDYFGGNVLVASGIVYEVGTDWSVIKLLKKYKEIQIRPGFAARGY